MQGARTRTEFEYSPAAPGASTQAEVALITQCDRKQTVAFDSQHKTFTEWPMVEWSERIRTQGVRRSEPDGPDVSVAMDSVDTGERRQAGPYLARHVKTTIRIEPAAETKLPPRVEELDGWYIDLPHANCEDRGDQSLTTVAWLTIPNERVHFSQTGSGKRGYPVEEVSRTTMRGQTYETRMELLEASADPLDPQLFELPAGYSHALRSPLGTDYTRPDTLSNRTAAYWTYFRQRIAQALRSGSQSHRQSPCPPAPRASL
jgi:hypothetical protein